MNKAALYFHIPFCLRKCLYCDFCSYTGKTNEDMRAYTAAMEREMRAYAERAKGKTFNTLFFGGGTPTLLPIDCFSRLLDTACRLFSVETDAEITAEANPATASRETLTVLRGLGINRLSVGVQSTSDGELSALGRLHTGGEALAFLDAARGAGFENLNVDLMYGIPHQTVASAGKTLEAVLAFSPEHISAYSLMIEEGTPFGAMRDTLPLPLEEEEDAVDTLVKETLRESGYHHYEISNYAKAGRECRHNLHYWHSDDYLGFGVAAYSFFDGVRFGNGEDLGAYLADPTHSICEREVLNRADLAYEWIMLRFRLAEGLSVREYNTAFDTDFEAQYAEELCRFEQEGLLVRRDGRVRLTERGMRLSNTVLLSFLPK